MNDWLEQNKKKKLKTKTGSLTSRQEELSFKSPARSIFSLIKISPKYSPLSPPSLFLPHPISQAAAAQAGLTVARQAKEFSVDPGSVRYLLPCALSSPLVHLETPTNMFLLPGPLYLGSSFVQLQGLNIDRQTGGQMEACEAAFIQLEETAVPNPTEASPSPSSRDVCTSVTASSSIPPSFHLPVTSFLATSICPPGA